MFIYPLRIYIEDTDYGGIVYHANYLKFFERARSEWAEQIGWGMEWQKSQQLAFVIRSATLDFLKPARLHEKVEVVTRIQEIKAVSMVFDQHLRRLDSSDIILCKAVIKVVCVDANLRPHVLPDFLHQLLH